MLAWIACVLLGHRPWSVVAEVVRAARPLPVPNEDRFTGDAFSYENMLKHRAEMVRLTAERKLVILTCVRCGALKTFVL